MCFFRFYCKNNGVLYENETIQIGVKTECRGNLARLAIFYGNKTSFPFLVSHHIHRNRVSRQVLFGYKLTKNASEASYVYTSGGQKYIKNARIGPSLQLIENLKLAVKQCYQTVTFHWTKIGENPKIEKFQLDNMTNFWTFLSSILQKVVIFFGKNISFFVIRTCLVTL